LPASSAERILTPKKLSVLYLSLVWCSAKEDLELAFLFSGPQACMPRNIPSTQQSWREWSQSAWLPMSGSSEWGLLKIIGWMKKIWTDQPGSLSCCWACLQSSGMSTSAYEPWGRVNLIPPVPPVKLKPTEQDLVRNRAYPPMFPYGKRWTWGNRSLYNCSME
jgi:hypothetical protein